MLSRVLTAAAIIAMPLTAQAQSWVPGSNAPFYYGNLQQTSPAPQSFSFSVPEPPRVPQVRSYVPAPTTGPAGYPCTIPGCR